MNFIVIEISLVEILQLTRKYNRWKIGLKRRSREEKRRDLPRNKEDEKEISNNKNPIKIPSLMMTQMMMDWLPKKAVKSQWMSSRRKE